MSNSEVLDLSRRVMITGGSGFIGTNLVSLYLAKGWRVLNVDIAAPRNSEHVAYWQNVSILDSSALDIAVQGFRPELVLHMAARTDLQGSSVRDYDANIAGVENVIAAVNNVQCVKRIVYASSRLVFRIGAEPQHDFDYSPNTCYGESKIKGEELVRSQGAGSVPWVLVRPTSIWGPWFDVPYRDFFMNIARNTYFHPKGRAIPKSFGYVGNATHEISVLAETSLESCLGGVFFIADYEPVDVLAWGSSIQKCLGSRPIRQVPLSVLFAVAVSGDFLQWLGMRNCPLTRFRLNNLLTPMVYDLKPLRTVVGELPFSVQVGVEETVKWLQSVAPVK